MRQLNLIQSSSDGYLRGATPQDAALLRFISNGSIGVTTAHYSEWLLPVVDALNWRVSIQPEFPDKTLPLPLVIHETTCSTNR